LRFRRKPHSSALQVWACQTALQEAGISSKGSFSMSNANGAIALSPYVYLYGRVAEALEFYETVFGGSYEIVMRDERGMISHATFAGPGFTLMFSDGGSQRTVDPSDGNVSLQLAAADASKARNIYEALADGGYVKVPFGTQPWGGVLGVVHDRYGTEWIVTG
ncbi:MAG TPA: VOC family protein, partial [Candidatus Tumulicola sp.]